MRYTGTLIAVEDMERSKRFYHDVLGLEATADFGANVTLDGGLFLQTRDTWASFIRTDRIVLPHNAGELYFEEENIEEFCERLRNCGVRYVHEPVEHPWGQRVVRFYDPDGHIIEVGEKLEAVVGRFLAGGLTVSETARRMDVPEEYVLSCLKNDSP
ncbi:MAG: VOC family protein [Firmicutes bacterium]|nr:VOC family protein [Bacillota bacterium]